MMMFLEGDAVYLPLLCFDVMSAVMGSVGGLGHMTPGKIRSRLETLGATA